MAVELGKHKPFSRVKWYTSSVGGEVVLQSNLSLSMINMNNCALIEHTTLVIYIANIIPLFLHLPTSPTPSPRHCK